MTRNGSISSPFNDLHAALINPKLSSGDAIYLRAGTHTLTADATLTASGITIRPYPGERAVIDIGSFDLTVNGANVTLKNLEIMSSDGVRETAITGGAPADITMGSFNVFGANFVMTGCSLHDIDGLGWWSPAHGGLMRDCLLYNMGWIAPDRGHGHLLYSQHAGTVERLVDNCIFGQSYSYGVHHYGGGATLDNLTVQNTIHYTSRLVIGGESSVPSAAGIVLRDCSFFGTGANLGYNSVNLWDLTLEGNYWGLSNCDISPNWEAVTEIGTVKKSAGNNDVFVYPCVTAPRVAHIAVYNWQQLAAVSVDLSALALTTGATYRLRNALDPLSDYTDFAYDGSGALSVNMTARSVATPIGAAAPLVAWDVRFGAFVLETV